MADSTTVVFENTVNPGCIEVHWKAGPPNVNFLAGAAPEHYLTDEGPGDFQVVSVDGMQVDYEEYLPGAGFGDPARITDEQIRQAKLDAQRAREGIIADAAFAVGMFLGQTLLHLQALQHADELRKHGADILKDTPE